MIYSADSYEKAVLMIMMGQSSLYEEENMLIMYMIQNQWFDSQFDECD